MNNAVLEVAPHQLKYNVADGHECIIRSESTKKIPVLSSLPPHPSAVSRFCCSPAFTTSFVAWTHSVSAEYADLNPVPDEPLNLSFRTSVEDSTDESVISWFCSNPFSRISI